MKMSVQAVKEHESKLIGEFPNTYTYSKHLSEKNLFSNHGNVKTVIIRPSIIACADN
jgi:nucleoside-diphosphate-sugar epimerase